MTQIPRSAIPRAPSGLPIVGNLIDFGKDPIGFLTNLVRNVGDIAAFSMNGHTRYFLGHPDDIELVLLETGKRFDKGYLNAGGYSMPRLLGNGLLSSEGDFWKRQRKLSQPSFHSKRISLYAETMTLYTERMLSEWAEGQTRDAHDDMMFLTQAIVAKTLFDADIANEAREVGEMLTVVLDEATAETRSIQMLLPPSWMTPTRKRVNNAVTRMEHVIARIIDERRANPGDRHDLLSMLLEARDDDGSAMSDVQLRDEVMTLYLAGHETTANTLSWIWHELSRNTALRDKLEAELDTVLQGRTPVMDDLRALPYTNALIEETLRMYPAAWMFARVATEDVEIRGHLLPKGAQLWISPYIVQHDPRWYDAPDTFDPERWLDGRTAKLHKHAFFPFGGGPRVCIGNSFARMESVLLLATIAQRFRLHVIDPGSIALDPLITLRPKNGIKVRIEARSAAQPANATAPSGATAQPEFALPAA